MVKQRLLAVVIGAFMVTTLPGMATARVDGGCSSGVGWQRFQVFVEDVFQADAWVSAFPTNAAALEDGIYTLEELEEGLRGLDNNGNGWLCVKDVYLLNGANGMGFSYYVSTVDDNAAT